MWNMGKEKEQKKKCTSIGGQAVIEGVMMRGKTAMATAVRDSDGIIRVETSRLTPPEKTNKFLKLPIIRGVVSLIQSLVGGTSILMRSAEVFGEEEPSRFEKWVSKKFNVNIMSVISFFSLIIGLGLAIFLFMWLPQHVRQLIESWVGGGFAFGVWAKNFIEGGLKLAIFLGYILFCYLIKDVRRTFMYHGAEHKTISCYEKGLELTVANAKKCTRVHNRCGTTFIVFVMLISIVLFACVEALIGVGVERIYRVLLKLALFPIVAGLSYELLKGLAKTNFWLLYPLKVPGLLLQRLTTKEPDDEMIEVAITAFNKVLEMDSDPSIKEQKFVTAKKRKDVTDSVINKLKKNGIDEIAEAEWIVSITLDVKRDEVYAETLVKPKQIDEINKIVEERITGRPLWYCIGDTNFYGYTIKVDERVLIPRPETELLVEQGLKVIKDGYKVLDLCTGSGAIAISIKKENENAQVFASDVSVDALTLAKENAQVNGAEIEFINSDMFEELGDNIFDVIISNPPYIMKSDLDGLQNEVKDFEPILALDGGSDGLDFYRIIAKNANKYLTKNGVLLLECGINQAEDISKMLSKNFSSVEVIKDYENIDRIVKAVL